MIQDPELILRDYSKVLSDALLEVANNGYKRYERLEMNLGEIAGFSHDQLIRSGHYSAVIEAFSELKDPCVYWFKILDENNLDKLWNGFNELKKEGNLNLPRSKKVMPTGTDILYLGKVKFNLLRRMKEHLGFTRSTRTQSLQLVHWAAPIGLKIEINVMEFQQETSNLVGAFEFKLAREMKTILGSHKT